MKSYTDLEQSKKLAEILPLESADMHWQYIEEDNGQLQWFYFPKDFSINQHNNIPCWSLAALLGALPNNENISTNLSKGGYKIPTLEYTTNWFVDYEDETNGLNNCTTSADNPIDVCVEMIIKLHELKLL